MEIPKPVRSTCPVACTLDLVGDRWTLLVLRDLMLGKQHFDELLASREGIATNVLSERLKRLSALGMVEVSIDPTNRRRKRYTLTERGKSFWPVLAALARWGLANLDGTRAEPEVGRAIEQLAAAKRTS